MDGWMVVVLILAGFIGLVALGWWLIWGREGPAKPGEP
jgi:hypothetical protein